jgi:hypothetical protein
MEWQKNKVINLKLAVAKLDGLILHPGETFSYWKLIGKPTYRKGYREGMVLFLGRIGGDIGGGSGGQLTGLAHVGKDIASGDIFAIIIDLITQVYTQGKNRNVVALQQLGGQIAGAVRRNFNSHW